MSKSKGSSSKDGGGGNGVEDKAFSPSTPTPPRYKSLLFTFDDDNHAPLPLYRMTSPPAATRPRVERKVVSDPHPRAKPALLSPSHQLPPTLSLANSLSLVTPPRKPAVRSSDSSEKSKRKAAKITELESDDSDNESPASSSSSSSISPRSSQSSSSSKSHASPRSKRPDGVLSSPPSASSPGRRRSPARTSKSPSHSQEDATPSPPHSPSHHDYQPPAIPFTLRRKRLPDSS
eukprot:TRINITY_DN3089_c1_g1_i1.p1 TRINITY_DN3089_c1_g1~~TRINITY_DN3089_c1_g1_i1.p1  ORF type:complete len:244 (+),score=63.70 TRINITY_DN3089_c1_g1_i1:35-733(+)